jgi:pimeloyl-ACP methyl ester carboxylesterase
MRRSPAGGWRGLTAMLAVLALPVLSACTEAGDDEATGAPRVRFGSCGDQVSLDGVQMPANRQDQLMFSCGRLRVPLDHAHPDGEHISLAVVRVRHRHQSARIGSLVMNPGGPGQPGLSYHAYWSSWLSDDVLDTFDVVTFDPRGTGASAPINCPAIDEDSEPTRFPDLLSAPGYADATRVNRHRTDACLDLLGRRAPFFTTEATARDLDLLRGALGDDRLTYVGFSYGAKLGGEYAHLFPDRVRGLVLDAPSDPTTDPVATTEVQVAGFEHAFAEYADDCAARPSCSTLGDPRKFVVDLVRTANATPIHSGRPGDELPATGADVLTAVQGLLYDDATWSVLDAALTEAADGDSGSVFEAIDHLHRRVPDDAPADADDAGFVINCNDRPPGAAIPVIKATAARLVAAYPVFGAFGSWSLLECTFWPEDGQILELPTAPKAPAILVIGTVHDPATPYPGAVRLAETLGSGHLLTWEGEGHTAYGQSDCIDRLVDRYLIATAVPPADTRCPA